MKGCGKEFELQGEEGWYETCGCYGYLCKECVKNR